MVFVVELAEGEDALAAAIGGKHMEVEQHHLALEVGQAACHAIVVRQHDVDDVGLGHLAGVHFQTLLAGFHDALGLHPLDGDVVQVLATQRFGVELVPTGGYGREGTHVVGVGTGIEHHEVGVAHHDALEEGKIGVGLHRLFIYIVGEHRGLVLVDKMAHAVFHGLGIEFGCVVYALGLGLQFHLHQRQFPDLLAVLAALHLVVGGHVGVGGLHGDGLGGVDGEADYLLGYAKPVELGCVGRCL